MRYVSRSLTPTPLLSLHSLTVPVEDPKMRLRVLSPTELLVTWEPLPPRLARGTITAYKVLWTKKGLSYYNLKEVRSDTQRYTCSDTQRYSCSDTQRYSCSDTQRYSCSDTQRYTCSDTQRYTCSDRQVHL